VACLALGCHLVLTSVVALERGQGVALYVILVVLPSHMCAPWLAWLIDQLGVFALARVWRALHAVAPRLLVHVY